MPALLEVKGLSKSFGSTRALDGVSFSSASGEIHCLVGENGAGKSTLLKILAGVFPPDEGAVSFAGESVRAFHPDEAARRGIAIIYQEFSLIPALTVAENIHIGRESRGPLFSLDRRAMRKSAAALLARVGLAVDPDRRIDTLTVAEQQAVEIARALSVNARLLILDEPTAALAERETRRLLGILSDVRNSGAGIIFVSHRLHEVLGIADTITVLKDGRVVGSDAAARFDESRLISMMVGRELSHTFPARPATTRPEVVLEARDLTARDGAFSDVGLALHQGEILGIAGLEGHGQRELLRAMFGLAPLSRGQLRIGARVLARPTPRRCIGGGIVFVSDDRKGEGLILPFAIRANMALPTMSQRQTLSFIHGLAERRLAEETSRRLKVQPPGIDRLVRYLSGGNQQKVVLGKWLAAEPKVLLLSEPTRGIDVGTRVEIYDLLRRLADTGLGIIAVSRDMIELLGISDRILVMADGRIAAELAASEASEEAIMRAIVAGGRRGADWSETVRAAG